MSEYIHEIILHDYIIEKIADMNLSVKYNKSEQYNLVSAKLNIQKTFWDLEGKLENGVWIPIEVEWISDNFISHGHKKSKDFDKFIKRNGILLTLRKSKEIEKVQQISILENVPEKQFKNDFKRWFKPKSNEYIDKTLDNYLIGNYERKIPRILLYPLSKAADNNYFSSGSIYKKDSSNPCLLGFKEAAYNANVFIRDIRPNDICLFIYNSGSKVPRNRFIEKIKNSEITVHRLIGFKINSKIIDRREKSDLLDDFYWPDEIKDKVLRYPYVCKVEAEPFISKSNFSFPYINLFTESTWESFRSCMLHKVYREISAMDFSLFLSSL